MWALSGEERTRRGGGVDTSVGRRRGGEGKKNRNLFQISHYHSERSSRSRASAVFSPKIRGKKINSRSQGSGRTAVSDAGIINYCPRKIAELQEGRAFLLIRFQEEGGGGRGILAFFNSCLCAGSFFQTSGTFEFFNEVQIITFGMLFGEGSSVI